MTARLSACTLIRKPGVGSSRDDWKGLAMRNTRRSVLFGSLVVVGVPLALAAACGDDDFMGPELIAMIDLSIGDCSGLRVDETCQLEVVARTQEGTVIEDPRLNWRTPDITVATVDFQGRVTGVAEGNATIFVQSTPGPDVCQFQEVICDTQTVSVSEPAGPGPGPQP